MNQRAGSAGARNLAGLIVLVSFACPLCFADAPALPEKVTTVEGITEYRLANGLRVLLFPDASRPTVTVNLTVFVGSRQEGYGETGMAHLLEHMLFKGTPTHPEVVKDLKLHGANYNGTTWVDRTNYFETMPATDVNLEFGISLEADRLVHSNVAREDLLKEMTVVRSEFEMGENNPEYILSQRMMAVAYEWHNYGKSTIGNRSDIERVPIDRLQAFYRKYYRPDNAMLVVAGQFDPVKALAYIGKDFGILKRPERSLDNTYTEEPPQDGERRVVLRRVGKIGTVGAVYHICAGAHEDFAPLQVLNGVLTSEPAGRLYKALVETKKATGVYGTANGWHDPGVIEIMAQVDPKNSLDDVRDTMVDVLEGLGKEKITPEEVNRAKRELLTQRELLMTRSDAIGRVLSEWAAMGDWRLFFLHRDRLEKVTLEDVKRVADHYLLRSNRTVGVFIPTKQPERAYIPPNPDVEALVQDYKGRSKAMAAGEAFDPTPENIEKRVQRSELPEGLKLALLPKKTRGESVVAKLTLRYGNKDSLRGHTSATQFLGSLMTHGTKKHNYQQLEDELNNLGARVHAMDDLGAVSFIIQAKRDKLPAVLHLVGEMLREPTFPAAEFDILKRATRDGLEKGLVEPKDLAIREIRRRLNPYPKDDVRYTPTIEESIERLNAVTVEEVRKLYAEQMGAQHGELAVVGDFDPAATRKLVQELFGGWQALVPYERIARPAQTDVPGSRKDILTPDKANAVYLSGEKVALTDTDPDYPAMEVANFLFGGGALSSRLADRVRRQEGLSYGIMSQFSADAQDKSGSFLMFAICNPSNIDKVDKAITEELDRLLKDGISAGELAEAKGSYLEQQKVQRSNDMSLASLLAQELFNGRTFAYYANLEKKVALLEPGQTLQAFAKYIQPKRLVTIRAGDFTKKSAADSR